MHSTCCTPSSETQRQIVGARKSLNGRENMARRKVKNGEKSPWGQCLTRPVPNGRRRSALWLGRKTQKFSGTNQKPVPKTTQMRVHTSVYLPLCDSGRNIKLYWFVANMESCQILLSLQASSPFGGIAKSRESRTQKETECEKLSLNVLIRRNDVKQ